MNVMVVGLLAIACYFVVVVIWMRRQERHLPAAREGHAPEQDGGAS